MANTLFVAEFAETSIGPAGRISQIPQQPPLTTYTLATGAVSSFFNAKTRMLRLHAQTGPICYLITTAGTNAATTDTRLAQNQTEYVGVPLGGTFKVAAIDSA